MGVELGIFGVGDRHPYADTGRTMTEHERISGVSRITNRADDASSHQRRGGGGNYQPPPQALTD
jgi:hypothetical protein